MIDIKGHHLEYIDETHTYLCDGVILPSITQMLGVRFGKKYEGIDKAVLDRAAEKGTAVHEAVEAYCKYGKRSDLPEVRGFEWLMNKYNFQPVQNEVPVLLFRGDKPIAAGRLDMVLAMDGVYGLADLKRTAALDKEYVGYQLNLYRLAFQQTTGVRIDFLNAIWLRDEKRKLVNIPINEPATWALIDEYERSKEHEQDDVDWAFN